MKSAFTSSKVYFRSEAVPDLSLGLVGVLDGLGSVLGWLLGGLINIRSHPRHVAHPGQPSTRHPETAAKSSEP